MNTAKFLIVVLVVAFIGFTLMFLGLFPW